MPTTICLGSYLTFSNKQQFEKFIDATWSQARNGNIIMTIPCVIKYNNNYEVSATIQLDFTTVINRSNWHGVKIQIITDTETRELNDEFFTQHFLFND